MGDLRLALRGLAATPVVSAVAVLSLTLGIGANTALFSLINSLLLRTLPVEEPQRLVTISSDLAIKHGFTAGAGWNHVMWERLQERVPGLFDGAFAWSAARFNLVPRGETQLVEGLYASGDFFATLGIPALIGRTFTRADDVRGGGPGGPVAVISYGLWQRRFGGDPKVVGAPLAIDGAPVTIVGVTPPEFFGIEVGRAFDVALPLAAMARSERAFALGVMLRLKPAQPLAATTATLRAIQPEITPATLPSFAREPFTPVPAGTGISMGLRQRYERPLLTILAVASVVLLVACANIANLLLARATARQRELSVRLALGAPQWRLVRLLLVESLVLASLGAMTGMIFAMWSTQALVAQLSTPDARILLELPLDWRVLGFTAAVTVVTAILFGTAPAFRMLRVTAVDFINEQARGHTGAARSGVAGSLVAAQVALSLVLVVTAGLLVRTFERLTSVPLGFDRDRVLVANVDTARAHRDQTTRIDFYHRLVTAARSVAGASHAAASMSIPGGGGAGLIADARGRAVDGGRRTVTNFVTPGWFAAYGITLRSGRDLSDGDTATAQPVAVVNDAFARAFFPERDPIGEAVDYPRSPPVHRTIVGVVSDTVAGSLRDPAPPMIYVPLAQSAGLEPPGRTSINLTVRSASGPPTMLAPAVGQALTAVSRELSYTFRRIEESMSAAVAQERLLATLSGFFGALALLLAGLGLYGVTSYGVSRRRTEIGIRMALGADPPSVVRLIVSQISLLIAAGVVAGGAASLWLSRFVAPLLYGLEPDDPTTFTMAALTLVSVAALAGWLPAARASRIDPSEVLRSN